MKKINYIFLKFRRYLLAWRGFESIFSNFLINRSWFLKWFTVFESTQIGCSSSSSFFELKPLYRIWIKNFESVIIFVKFFEFRNLISERLAITCYDLHPVGVINKFFIRLGINQICQSKPQNKACNLKNKGECLKKGSFGSKFPNRINSSVNRNWNKISGDFFVKI